MQRYVLVVTKVGDTTADYTLNRMATRGIPFIRLDSDRFGSDVQLDLRFGETQLCAMHINGLRLTPDNIAMVWIRRINPPQMSEIKDSEARSFAEQELEFSLHWLLASLDCKFLDREEDLLRARNKFDQLMIAKKLGLRIPKTLVTNSPELASQFITTCQATVAKSVGGYGVRREDGFEAIYTIEVTQEKQRYLETIELSPVCLQEKIEKEYELRVTVVGTKVFSCKILSQQSERTRLDWRRYDLPNTPHEPCTISASLQEQLFALMRHYNIHFASFDLIVTSKGEIVFLEMNPNSQWVWIEELAGLPITDALIDELTAST